MIEEADHLGNFYRYKLSNGLTYYSSEFFQSQMKYNAVIDSNQIVGLSGEG